MRDFFYRYNHESWLDYTFNMHRHAYETLGEYIKRAVTDTRCFVFGHGPEETKMWCFICSRCRTVLRYR